MAPIKLAIQAVRENAAYLSPSNMSSHPSAFRFNDLPLELQQEIFAMDAREEMSNAIRLVRVAKKVYGWISPIIYNMVTLGSDDTALFVRTLSSKPAEFFAAHVKYLCLSVSVDPPSAEKILSVCTGVKFLAFWVDYHSAYPEGSTFHMISPLPLRRLSIEIKHLHGLCRNSLCAPNELEGRWHTSLTHLDIVFWSQHDSTALPDLSLLPSLTHLGLWHPHGLINESVITRILSTCEKLELLLVALEECDLIQNPTSFRDPRVVCMPYPTTVIQDWEASFIGLPNTWSKAERILLARGDARTSPDGSAEDI